MHQINKQRLFAIVKLPNGKLVKVPVKQNKVHDKVFKDVESGLYLYKKKHEYNDKKDQEAAGLI